MHSLYLDANILSPDGAGYRQPEVLCQAAEAIVSSLTDKKDTATSLALQLLLPYIVNGDKDNGDDTDTEEEVLSFVEQLLHRYDPHSDAGAQQVLNLVQATMDINVNSGAMTNIRNTARVGGGNGAHRNVVLVEACEAVALCRYRHYWEGKGQPGIAISWLLQGIDCRVKMIGGDDTATVVVEGRGSCYRTLCSFCTVSTSNLLSLLTGGNSNKDAATSYGETYNDTTAVTSTLRNYLTQYGSSSFLTESREVQVMFRIHAVVEAFVIDRDNNLVAKQILACLEERKGPAGRLLFKSFQWLLLLVAKEILREEECQDPNCMDPVSAFDSRGIRVLMETLMQVSILHRSDVDLDEEIQELRGYLSRGLARAFVMENARKRDKITLSQTTRDAKIADIRSHDLDHHPMEVQKAVIRHMLDL